MTEREGDDPADEATPRDSHRDLREWLGREPTDDEIELWLRRGFTDVIAESIADGIDREPEMNRWLGGPTHARVLDFGEVLSEGRTLRITVELVQAADPPDMPPDRCRHCGGALVSKGHGPASMRTCRDCLADAPGEGAERG